MRDIDWPRKIARTAETVDTEMLMQRTARKSAVCTDGTFARQGGRTSAGGHVPEGTATTTQVQDSDKTADEVDGEHRSRIRILRIFFILKI